MRALLLFALLGSASSACAVEAVLTVPHDAADCPPPAADAQGGDAEGTAPAPAESSRTGDGEEPTSTGSRQRTQVRWHSLLPGMVR